MNVATIVGYLGQDVTFASKGDTDYTRLSVATTQHWRDSDGDKRERTDWHRVVAFGGLARSIKELKKGGLVAVTGMMRQNEYEKDGTVYRTTEILATKIDIYRWASKDAEAPRDAEPAEAPEADQFDDDDDIPF